MKVFVSTVLLMFALAINGQSQSELLSKLSSDKLFACKINKDRNDFKVAQSAIQWPVSLKKEGAYVSEVTVKRSGVIDEVFKPDVLKHSTYFYNPLKRMVCFDGVIMYYKVAYEGYIPEYFLSDKKEKLTVITDDNISSMVAKFKEYLRVEFEKQKAARNNLQTDLANNRNKEALLNSIKGKKITSIQLKWMSESADGMQSKVEYGIIAKAKDGKVYKTRNLGGKTPFEDFKLVVSGAISGEQFLTIGTDLSKIPNDKITVSVYDKFTNKFYSKSSIKIAYRNPISLAYRGEYGCGNTLYMCAGCGGGYGGSFLVEVQNDATRQYVIYTLKGLQDGKKYHKIKLKKGVAFSLDIRGGDGCKGKTNKNGRGGTGGAGGRGGNIKIVKKGSVVGDNFKVYNSGGTGGNGGDGILTGSRGRNGTNGRRY